MKAFTFFSDPSHGWLKVERADAFELGLTASDFSKFTYIGDHGAFFLEEDCDAPKFLRAFEARHGAKPVINERHTNANSSIRSYRRNG